MILCPNAKINIGLDVVSRREDGYHDIESLFVPVPELRDVLEVVKADKPGLKTYGLECDVPPEKNLCFKAFRLMQERFGIGNINIFLYKNIPMGAGLGGGSSDAAFTLVAINEVFGLGLRREQLAAIAAELGSDCPFFVYNRPMFASGRGEILTPYPIDLTGYHIEVITPGIHISTPEAYKGVDSIKFGLGADASTAAVSMMPNTGAVGEETVRAGNRREESTGPERSCFGDPGVSGLKNKLSLGIDKWRENVINDFEAYAFAKYPILAETKQSLYDKGAVYASMTGSGSAIYGIFAR